ncbi:MAG: hypothetical protein RLZZ323_1444 [Bacteroidota bacterium]|jgi:hypothetical protein
MELDRNTKQQLTDEQMNKIHLEDLGFDIPKNYFALSKNEILENTIQREKRIFKLFSENNPFLKIAASIVLIIGSFIYIQFYNRQVTTEENTAVRLEKINETTSLAALDSNQTNVIKAVEKSNANKFIENKKKSAEDVVQNENDILVKSLFVEESEVDKYIENSILEDI